MSNTLPKTPSVANTRPKTSRVAQSLINAKKKDFFSKFEIHNNNLTHGKLVDFNYIFAHGEVDNEKLIDIPDNCIVLMQCSKNEIYFNFANDLKKIMFISEHNDKYLLDNDHSLNQNLIMKFFDSFAEIFNKPKPSNSQKSNSMHQNSTFCCFINKCPDVNIIFGNDNRKLYVTTPKIAHFMFPNEKETLNAKKVYEIMEKYYMTEDKDFMSITDDSIRLQILISLTVQIEQHFKDLFDLEIIPKIKKSFKKESEAEEAINDFYKVVQDVYNPTLNDMTYNNLLKKYVKDNNKTVLSLSDYLTGLKDQESDKFHIVIVNTCRDGVSVPTNVSGTQNEQYEKLLENQSNNVGMFNLYNDNLTYNVLKKFYSTFNWQQLITQLENENPQQQKILQQNGGKKHKKPSTSKKRSSKVSSKNNTKPKKV